MQKISLIPHAEARLESYNISRRFVIEAVNNPDEVVRGKNRGELERWIAHKLLDDEYMLRVVYEVRNWDLSVITLYISKRRRYYRGGIREDKI
ncbi:MAG: hypothetical protein KAR25_06680 [Methanosarcinales archaeon]|nr:hypothetical protein [Methanosarcinales archaeon]